jgi:hypothetical protein
LKGSVQHKLFIFDNDKESYPKLKYIKEVYFDTQGTFEKEEFDKEWKPNFEKYVFAGAVVTFKKDDKVFKFQRRIDDNANNTVITLHLQDQTIELVMEPNDNMTTLRQFIVDNLTGNRHFSLDRIDSHNFEVQY